MTSHISHPATLEVGLVDGCPRCEQHAEHPLAGLDAAHLASFWAQMLAVEFSPAFTGPHYRSEAEAACCHQLLEYARFLQRIGIDPRTVEFV